MYLFEAQYRNMRNNEKRIEKIEVNETPGLDEKEYYIYSMSKAFELKKDVETLETLDFIGC